MISFIWAQDIDGVIGRDGKIPWHIPVDMKYFKNTTMGHPLVSGKRTFDSYKRVLPGRENIVLTNQINDLSDEVTKVTSLTELLELMSKNPDKEYFISGGAQVFKQLLPYVDKLYKTTIHGHFAGDTFMPVIDYSQFKLISSHNVIADDYNSYACTFEIFERQK